MSFCYNCVSLVSQFAFQNDFNFEYLPLKTGETEAKLEFLHNDLGLYTYDLKLKATPAGPERALYFRTPLGIVQTQTTRFMNFYKQKTDYTCTVSTSYSVSQINTIFPIYITLLSNTVLREKWMRFSVTLIHL